MRKSLFAIIALLITLAAVACSGGSNPSIPYTESNNPLENFRFIQIDRNTIILGAWDVILDPENLSVEAAPARSIEIHVNVSKMLQPPKCYDCFLVKNLSYDPSTKIVTIDVGFRNPSTLTGYDVRGIVTSFGVMEFLNPDGYTELFTPIPFSINPFIAYMGGPGNREFPGQTIQYEKMEIYNPNFPKFSAFTYVVEASWPSNCKEPYEVTYGGTTGSLFSDGSNAPLIQVVARDWQNDVASVSIDLAPIGGTTKALTPSGSLPNVWATSLSCAPGTPIGQYKLKVTGVSSPPVDQTANMYNFVTVNVIAPPTPGTEVFGIPKRLSSTAGESFIWPRHSIAVTSDNRNHVVWVDNSPDPDSNQFHVYYTSGSGNTWTIPKQIDSVAGWAIYATIAAKSDNTIYIVWEDQRNYVLGSDIFIASSTDNFASEKIIVDGDDGYRNVHPKIEAGSDGTLHMVWHSSHLYEINKYEYNVWYMRKPSAMSDWAPAQNVANAAGVIEAFPAVVPGTSASAYIAYQSDSSGDDGIYFTKYSGGSFSTPKLVTLNNAYQPAMDIAPNGKLVLGYFDYGDGSFSDIYARISTDDGATWGTPQKVSSSDAAYQYAPDVECSNDGDYHFSWHEENTAGNPGRVLYREFLSTGTWVDQTEIVDSAGMGAFPSMDSDNSGHIHMIYELYTPVAPPGVDNYEIWYRDSVQ